MIINIGRRGLDGRTAWELRYGRSCGRQMAEFSEQVLWRDDGKKSRLDSRGQMAQRSVAWTLLAEQRQLGGYD
eukprot:2900761-Amphidinium_carterae.1